MNSMIPEELNFLYRVLSAIGPNLKDFVLVGGFASFFYQFHERARSAKIAPLLTYDIDLASEAKVSLRGRKSVHQSLLEMGLREEFTGNCNPPLVKYFPKDKKPNMGVEFLTPLHGSEVKRGKFDITQEIQLGLSAQKLRFLDLLLKHPWKMNTSSVQGLENLPNLVVRTPHPSMFIMQKILISERRADKNRNKDFAYIYQTLVYFREDLKSLADEYEMLIDNREWKKWYRNFMKLSKEIFGTPQRDGPIEGSKILDHVTPEMISALVNRFISFCPKI